MKTIHNKMIVRPDPEKQGLIWLPPQDRTNYEEVPVIAGEVVEIGPEVLDVKPGERVMFTNHEDMHMDDLMVIYEADVLGVLE